MCGVRSATHHPIFDALKRNSVIKYPNESFLTLEEQSPSLCRKQIFVVIIIELSHGISLNFFLFATWGLEPVLLDQSAELLASSTHVAKDFFNDIPSLNNAIIFAIVINNYFALTSVRVVLIMQ